MCGIKVWHFKTGLWLSEILCKSIHWHLGRLPEPCVVIIITLFLERTLAAAFPFPQKYKFENLCYTFNLIYVGKLGIFAEGDCFIYFQIYFGYINTCYDTINIKIKGKSKSNFFTQWCKLDKWLLNILWACTHHIKNELKILLACHTYIKNQYYKMRKVYL